MVRYIKLGLLAVAVLIGVSVVLGSFYVNEEFERSVITRLGKVKDVTGPGLHWKTPFVEERHAADTRIEKRDLKVNVATKDNQPVDILITVNHRIVTDSDRIVFLYEQFGQRFGYEDRILDRMASDRAKSVIGGFNLEQIVPNREDIRLAAKESISASVRPFGVEIVDVQISNITFSQQYLARLEEVGEERAAASRADQERRRAVFEAQKAIATADGIAESKKLAAQAEAFRITAEREAEANGIRVVGEAKADALRQQAEALKNAPELIELTKAEALQNWDGSVPQFSTGGNGFGPISLLNLDRIVQQGQPR